MTNVMKAYKPSKEDIYWKIGTNLQEVNAKATKLACLGRRVGWRCYLTLATSVILRIKETDFASIFECRCHVCLFWQRKFQSVTKHTLRRLKIFFTLYIFNDKTHWRRVCIHYLYQHEFTPSTQLYSRWEHRKYPIAYFASKPERQRHQEIYLGGCMSEIHYRPTQTTVPRLRHNKILGWKAALLWCQVGELLHQL